MKTFVGAIVLMLALSGCVTREIVGGFVTREITITGVCVDTRGTPRSGVVATAKEIRGSLVMLLGPLAGPQLPEIRPLASATSGADGKFSLKVRSSRHMVLELKDSSDQRFFGSRNQLSIPESGEDFSISVLIEDGYLTGHWDK